MFTSTTRGAVELYDSHSCLWIFSHELSAFTAGLLQEEIQGILKGVKDGRVQQRAVLQVTASVRSHKATGRRINGHTAGGDWHKDASTLRHPLFPTRIKSVSLPVSLCWYEHKESASRQLYKAVKRKKKKKGPLCSTTFCSNASSCALRTKVFQSVICAATQESKALRFCPYRDAKPCQITFHATEAPMSKDARD